MADSGTCATCGQELDVPGKPETGDCGGDCVHCMADAGDPDCIYTMMRAGYRITSRMREDASFGGVFYPSVEEYWKAVNEADYDNV